MSKAYVVLVDGEMKTAGGGSRKKSQEKLKGKRKMRKETRTEREEKKRNFK